MTALDPDPRNELGKGLLRPDKEAELLRDGYIFACRLPDAPVGALLTCKRLIADAVTDGELDSPRYRRPIADAVTDMELNDPLIARSRVPQAIP